MKDTNTNNTKVRITSTNDMKRKRTTLIASSLVLCLLCVMTAVTYARYVTSASAKDTARIAKWGVEMSAVGTLYGEQYGTGGKPEAWSSSGKGTVHISTQGSNVIAPGTSNDGGLSISLTGTPEVKTNVKVELKSENIYLKKGTYAIANPVASGVVTAANYEALKSTLYQESDGTYTPASGYAAGTTYYTLDDKVTLSADYYPVVYTSSNAPSTDINSDSLNVIAKYIAGKLGDTSNPTPAAGVTTYTISKDYDPGTDLGTTLNMGAESIVWAWEYMRSNNETMYSGADTILGSIGYVPTGSTVVKASGANFVAVVNNTDYHLNTGLDLTMTVTQVD